MAKHHTKRGKPATKPMSADKSERLDNQKARKEANKTPGHEGESQRARQRQTKNPDPEHAASEAPAK